MMMGGKISIDQRTFDDAPAFGACFGVAAGVGIGIGMASGSMVLGVGLGAGLLVFMVAALCRRERH